MVSMLLCIKEKWLPIISVKMWKWKGASVYASAEVELPQKEILFRFYVQNTNYKLVV